MFVRPAFTSVGVAGDQPVGRVDNGLSRSIILGEQYPPCRVLLLELQQEAVAGAAEGVNVLVVVTDDAEANLDPSPGLGRRFLIAWLRVRRVHLSQAGQELDKTVLQPVDVLVLIDEDVLQSSQKLGPPGQDVIRKSPGPVAVFQQRAGLP